MENSINQTKNETTCISVLYNPIQPRTEWKLKSEVFYDENRSPILRIRLVGERII